MASNLRVDTILPSSGTTLGIGTANGTTNFTGNVGIAGTLTYEDVTNIDAVGLITARGGIKIGPSAGAAGTFFADGSYITAGILTATNVSAASSVTATTYYGSGANLTGIDATKIITGNTQVQTVDTGSDGHVKVLTEGSERLRITSAGKVLIGTTTPQGNANADDLVVSTSGHGGITIRSGTSHNSNLFFADGTSGGDEYRGWVDYKHNDNAMSFGTNAAERLRITSAGAWGIAGANYGTDGQVLTSGGSGAAVAWEDAGGGMFSRAWTDSDATETTITGGSGDTRVGGNSGANLNVTFTPPSTSTKYFYICYLHIRFSGGGQWGWRPQFTTNNGTSWTGIGNHPSFSHEHPNAVFREGFVQMRTFHPNTTNECKMGIWAQVWASHSGSITLNGSLQNSRIFLFEIADNNNFVGA